MGEFIQKSQKYTDFRNSLDVAINDMNASVQVRDMELTYGGALSTDKQIKMPINCPPPPVETVPDTVLPCLEAASNAKRISTTVAYVDSIKLDHTMKEDLKTKDYRMISEMTQCSSGKQFPCNEQVLFHKPSVDDYTLHCFVENQLISNINVDFSCFKNGFLKDYYAEYKAYLESLAVKWINFIEINIFPRLLCDTYKFQDTTSFTGFTNKEEFLKTCLQERSKLTGRDESLICGSTTCCDNAETHQDNLVCTNESIDHSKGSWQWSVTNGTCVSDCDIADLELSIYFQYTDESYKTGAVTVEAENDVTGMTTDQILASVVAKADDPVDVCLLNTHPGETCGFTYLDYAAGPDGTMTRVDENAATNAHYCLENECCVQSGNTSTCQAKTGSSCPTNTTVFWFNYSQHAECLKVQVNNDEGEVQNDVTGSEGAMPSED